MLDLRTVLFDVPLTAFFTLIYLLFFYEETKKYYGGRKEMLASTVLLILGVLLYRFKSTFGESVFVPFSLFIVLVSNFLFMISMRKLFSFKYKNMSYYFILLVLVPTILTQIIIYFDFEVFFRVLVSTSFTIVTFILTIKYVIVGLDKVHNKIRFSPLAWIMLFYILIVFFGFINALLLNIDYKDIGSSGIEVLLFLISSIIRILMIFGYTLLIHRMIFMDLELVNEENMHHLNIVRKLSETDHLTELLNRQKIDDVLSKYIEVYNRENGVFSIMFFDVDNFKKINDIHGHLVGDEVLKLVSSTINNTLRKSDSLGRWGGDEFISILPDTNLENAKLVKIKLKEAVSKLSLENIESLSISIGIAEFVPGMILHDLVKIADENLYKDKAIK